MAIGFLHFTCFCAADLYYLGNDIDGKPSTQAIRQFKRRLDSERHAIFTSASGQSGRCPFCGCVFELPDPETLDWLPFVSAEAFRHEVASMNVRETARSGYSIALPEKTDRI